ncbi:Oidioi.mRNA.OKI2018_I69.chr2.g7967.t1.cds [Oikopleura dioica]|uniref:Oidioi.mRNA.OKI2018_I69.chr2.g7967.t1.cds n=1 Tax=Oikopleura dioica TaxID=34765 RepID=A0ABN7TCC7_OIKDI|nr:Oidioi.mRNA.OKI2018_I69.chr2.g7967.t1.cds [Oikopleura dioica]
MKDGWTKLCYADTDSLMVAMTADSLRECVKPSLVKEWDEEMVPKWFAKAGDAASQKEPGLLKEEHRINKGWMIALSPKCYIMTECDRNTIEEEIFDPKNRHRVYELIDEHERAQLGALEVKRSAKGCSQSIKLRHLDYLAALVSDDMEQSVIKSISLFQFDQIAKRMKTKTLTKRVINAALKKRIIHADKITTSALQNADGTYL